MGADLLLSYTVMPHDIDGMTIENLPHALAVAEARIDALSASIHRRTLVPVAGRNVRIPL